MGQQVLFRHKEYSSRVVVSVNSATVKVFTLKRFGVVARSGKKFLRNYKRELKNGKGMDYIEAAQWRINQTFSDLLFSPLAEVGG